MSKYILKIFLLAIFSVLTLNGCMGNAMLPNNATQTGAATGAIAGAVIGANTKGHHKGSRMAVGALLGAALGGGVGYAIDEQTPQPQETGGWQ